MKALFALLLMAIALPARAVAIDVYLRPGLDHGGVIGEIKKALGIDYRYVDPSSGVMRPWRVTGGISIHLPHPAPAGEVERLKQVIEDLRGGMADPNFVAGSTTSPKSVEFGDVPVRVIEAAPTGSAAPAQSGDRSMQERIKRRLEALGHRPLSEDDVRAIANVREKVRRNLRENSCEELLSPATDLQHSADQGSWQS